MVLATDLPTIENGERCVIRYTGLTILADCYELADRNIRVIKCHVECDPKGYHQKEGQQDHLQEGVEHSGEHDDVNANEGELADDKDEVYPAQESGQDAELPLPVGHTSAVCVEGGCEDDREEVEREFDEPEKHS